MKISIITPSYQQGEFIERTIKSVLQQKDKAYHLDYVVMDGGSQDATVSILKQYQTELHWVSEADEGQAHAVNKGLQTTDGDIIGWLNSDDIYYPGTVKQVMAFFADHPAIDVVYGDAYFIDKNDKILHFYPTERWDLEKFKSRCFLSQPSVFFRRKVIEQYGLLDEKLHFCMDYEYWLRLGLKGARFAYLPKVLSATRIYAETKTASGYLKANQEAITMLKQHLDYLPAEWVVSHCGALVKSKYGYQFPHPFFIAAVWWHLWGAVGQYPLNTNKPLAWLQAQYAMAAKFLRILSFRLGRRSLV